VALLASIAVVPTSAFSYFWTFNLTRLTAKPPVIAVGSPDFYFYSGRNPKKYMAIIDSERKVRMQVHCELLHGFCERKSKLPVTVIAYKWGNSSWWPITVNGASEASQISEVEQLTKFRDEQANAARYGVASALSALGIALLMRKLRRTVKST